MFTPYVTTFIWSVIPLLELRASIPLGYFRYDMDISEVVIISILGGIITAALVLYLLPILTPFFERKIPPFHRLMQYIFKKTRAKHSERMEVTGEMILILIVAIPLPGSGAYTGALLAYLFGIRYVKALLLISSGIVLSGVLVGIITMFGSGLWEMFIGFF